MSMQGIPVVDRTRALWRQLPEPTGSIAATIIVAIPTLAIWMFSYDSCNSTQACQWFYLLPIVVLLSSMLVSMSLTLLFVGLNLVGMLLVLPILWKVNLDSLSGPVLALGVATLLIAFITYVHEQDLTKSKAETSRYMVGEARYRHLFESQPEPTCVYDCETLAILAVNDAAIQQYGFTRAEFLSKKIQEIHPAVPLPESAKLTAGTAGADKMTTARHTRKDGTSFDVKLTWHDLMFAKRRARIVVAEDITELRKAEEETRRLSESIQQSNSALVTAFDATLERWTRTLELRDKETEGHTDRIMQLTLRLAKKMGVDESDLMHIRRGALLHDIGKMGIPDAILLKPGPLSDKDWIIMRKHPTYALQMLQPIEYLRPALEIPYCHHERWDGTGYPRGLKGKEIPLAARLFAIVDVWDALSSDRPYREAWPKERVLEHIREQRGKHFDPEVVKAFLKMVEAENAARKEPLKVSDRSVQESG